MLVKISLEQFQSEDNVNAVFVVCSRVRPVKHSSVLLNVKPGECVLGGYLI